MLNQGLGPDLEARESLLAEVYWAPFSVQEVLQVMVVPCSHLMQARTHCCSTLGLYEANSSCWHLLVEPVTISGLGEQPHMLRKATSIKPRTAQILVRIKNGYHPSMPSDSIMSMRASCRGGCLRRLLRTFPRGNLCHFMALARFLAAVADSNCRRLTALPNVVSDFHTVRFRALRRRPSLILGMRRIVRSAPFRASSQDAM